MICIGNQTACWAATPSEPFDYAVANGFDAFEWFPDKKSNGGWDETDLNAQQRRDIREIAAGRGLRVSVHARWQANPLQPASFALFEKDIELARDLGAGLLNVHLYHEHGIGAFVEAIHPLIRLTAEAGIQLAIENTPHHSPEDFNELFAQLDHRCSQLAQPVGMCFDLGHANLCAATRNDYLKFLDRLAPRVPIIHLHLHENWGDADTHLPLFTGPSARDDSGVRGLLARLRQRNYSGSVILEQWPHPPSLLNQARDRLVQLLVEIPPPKPEPRASTTATDPSAAFTPHQVSPAIETNESTISDGRVKWPEGRAPTVLDEFTQKIIAGDQRSRSWREKLDVIRELLASETKLTPEHLVDIAVYLRFLGTGQIICIEDGRHFRPAHHAKIALQIQERLAQMSTPETAFIIRKILPWLPSSAKEFQRAEPLTRIRDIAHRNDIPSELKQEIKHTLQNKLHRCAGPEDLVASAALLKRITAPGANYSPEFVEQFKMFHGELQEFFNASSLEDRLQSLLPVLNENDAQLVRKFLAGKLDDTPAGRVAAFVSLTNLRRCFRAKAERFSEPQQQNFLLADIGLEDFAFALLSEIGNDFERGGEATWATRLEMLQQTMANLELSQVELEECSIVAAELCAWSAAFDAGDREQWLRLIATVGRARHLAENYCDRIMAWFPPRARALGLALGVAANAIQILGEAEIRGHLIFQLSKLTTAILRRIREGLHQPAYEVVVSGHTCGRIKRLETLSGNFHESTVALLKAAEGDEEIPAFVTGIVLAQDLPHLSHLAVRARQAGVVLLACEEMAAFEKLGRLAGKIISLTATSENVEWNEAESADGEVARSRAVTLSKVRLAENEFLISLKQATGDCAGGKSDGVRRLAELAQKSPASFKIPPGLVVPFGAMEAALRASAGIESEYARALADDPPDMAGRLAKLIEQVNVPEEIVAGVLQKFGSQARLMVRSSANVEDLQDISSAGLYESVANVLPADVAPAIRHVWASLWTRRAMLSRQSAGIPQSQAHMAVLIQEMVTPEFSFILHTVNPINQNRDEIYAEIVVGLGETLASATAQGNPYRLICAKHAGAVTTVSFANFSEALWPHSDGGVLRKSVDYSRVGLSIDSAARTILGQRLAAIALLVETEFGEPQDIEGVVKGEDVFLVQSRPQQGLKNRS